nr:hypothetical protein CFP56_74074 [Quercus suber]
MRTIQLPRDQQRKAIENETTQSSSKSEQGKDVFHVFDKIQPWDRCSVEIQIAEIRLQRLVHYLPSTAWLKRH